MNIVAWKCHVCQEEIAELSANVCFRCNLVACQKHSLRIRDKRTDDKLVVCSNCIRNSDDVRNVFYKIKRAFKFSIKKN